MHQFWCSLMTMLIRYQLAFLLFPIESFRLASGPVCTAHMAVRLFRILEFPMKMIMVRDIRIEISFSPFTNKPFRFECIRRVQNNTFEFVVTLFLVFSVSIQTATHTHTPCYRQTKCVNFQYHFYKSERKKKKLCAYGNRVLSLIIDEKTPCYSN